MSEAREQVLGAVRRSLRRGDTAETLAAASAATGRIAEHRRNLIPARADLPRAEQIALFETWAVQQAASVARVPDAAAVPGALAAFLKAENLPAEIRMAPDPELEALPWRDQPMLTVTKGPARESDAVSLTGALAGIAETGTLMLHSGPAGPTSLNFLPETHVIVLPAERVVASYEDGWDMLRARFGEGFLPRTVNFITGPSRTGDIEQTIQLGAHGPRRLHIILVGADAEGERG
ncbi:MAG: LUD domain-containing protein [Rhodospirillales bacterium]|nr:LUD domain-containing protein [Rhodospirillales bacterium]MDH3790264.1 LUD domain-containing protein [Rhodospirillales bacterium]MDH3912486.1 LUD domain-containing protein [Rhodospirillales bacterium]MDH3965720.1 LUD domain-containing protein [Rhodospirillales bacterium]